MNTTKKTAIVTGASSGLGKEVAEMLLKEDMTVFALARSIDSTEFSAPLHKIPCDIGDPESIDQAFAAIDENLESLDFLINCAGRGLVKDLQNTTREEVEETIAVNLIGNIHVAQAAYKRMVIQKSGHIINVSSTSGLKARDTETVYCASKWGLRGFTESLRLEGRKHNVKVTGVYPGGMQSENFWKITPGRDISNYLSPQLVAAKILEIIKEDPTLETAELVIERPKP